MSGSNKAEFDAKFERMAEEARAKELAEAMRANKDAPALAPLGLSLGGVWLLLARALRARPPSVLVARARVVRIGGAPRRRRLPC